MSLLLNTASLLMNTRRASDAEFGMMSTAERSRARLDKAAKLAASPNFSFGSNAMRQLHEQEKNDMANMHRFALHRLIGKSRAEAAEKRAKEDAKRFDIFA